MKRYCLACDLKNDPRLIEEYKKYHAPGNAWPEITESIVKSGVLSMEIFLTGNRLFMIMEVSDSFDFAKKAAMDVKDTKVQEWERLMDTYQQFLPWAAPGVKWVLMENIFKLNEQKHN